MLPAYIKLKFDQKCLACNEMITAGKNAFYIKEGNQVFHAKCGNPAWKIKGSPYNIRIQAAIIYKQNSMTVKDQVKLALRRFRRELAIPVQQMNLKPEVYAYLKQYHLIDFDEWKKNYVIIPKGFSWDVDTNSVRVPGFDENIMDRDANLEVVVEE